MENLNQKDFCDWSGYKLPKLGKIEPFWPEYTMKEMIPFIVNGLKNIYKLPMKVNIVNNSENPLPKYADTGSSGADVYADIVNINNKFLFDGAKKLTPTDLFMPQGSRALIPSGLHVAIPEGYEIQVRDRSGLALKHGIMVTNGIGTIDASYRGDIGIILTNTGSEPLVFKQGDRIAQLVLVKVEKIDWNLVESLDETERGEGGYGHSGI